MRSLEYYSILDLRVCVAYSSAHITLCYVFIFIPSIYFTVKRRARKKNTHKYCLLVDISIRILFGVCCCYLVFYFTRSTVLTPMAVCVAVAVAVFVFVVTSLSSSSLLYYEHSRSHAIYIFRLILDSLRLDTWNFIVIINLLVTNSLLKTFTIFQLFGD